MTEKMKIAPMLIVREILPGDRVTLTFQKAGYLYFQEIEREKLWTNESAKTTP